MMPKWSVYPPVTDKGNGLFEFPSNTGDTEISYLITYEDDNGCKTSTIYTVPACPKGPKSVTITFYVQRGCQESTTLRAEMSEPLDEDISFRYQSRVELNAYNCDDTNQSKVQGSGGGIITFKKGETTTTYQDSPRNYPYYLPGETTPTFPFVSFTDYSILTEDINYDNKYILHLMLTHIAPE